MKKARPVSATVTISIPSSKEPGVVFSGQATVILRREVTGQVDKPDRQLSPKKVAEKEELDWRVEECIKAWKAQRAGMFPRWSDIEVTALTKEACRKSILAHDRKLLSFEDREEWSFRSRARASGVGVFLSEWHVGPHPGGKRHLQQWRPWKVLRGSGDPVDTFAPLYFSAKRVEE